MSEENITWEAILNGDEFDTYDPVLKIIIVTEFREYEIMPMNCTQLVCRVMKNPVVTTSSEG